MATPSLRLSVEADDRASKILSDVTKKLGQTGDKAREAGRKVAAGSRQMDKSLNKVKTSAAKASTGINKLKTALTVVFAGAVLGAVIRGSDALLSAFSVQQQAVEDLALGLKNIGIVSRDAVNEQIEFAAALQKTTTFGDEAILSLQSQLTAFGLYGEELKQATIATLDLSSKLKISLQTSSILVGKAAQGMTNSLRSYGVIVDDTLPKNEKFAAAMAAINAQMGGAAQAQVNTYAGQTKQLGNRLGDLQEKLGEELLPVFKTWAGLLDSLISKTEELTGANEDSLSVEEIAIKRGEARNAVRRRALQDEINGRREFMARATQLREGIALENTLIRETERLIKVNKEAGKVATESAGKNFKAKKDAEDAAVLLAEKEKKLAVEKKKQIQSEREALVELGKVEAQIRREGLILSGQDLEASKLQIEEEFVARIQALDKLREAAGVTKEQIAPIFKALSDNASASLKKISTDGQTSFKEIREVAGAAASSMESAFATAFTSITLEGESTTKALEKAFKTTVSTILQEIAKIFIRRFVGDIASGIGFPVPGAQHGEARVPGPVGSPQLRVVHGGERISTFGDNSGGRSGGGGGSVVININLRVADLEAGERGRIIEAFTREIRDATNEARELAGELSTLQARTAGDAT